ncbi:MAG: nucleoside permease [Ferruginibacter sp.]
MRLNTRLQLSAMMFMEFFIWGGWFVTMGTYLSKTLKASDVQNGWAYSTQSWGAIIAPFIIGLIADKFFSAQKILGFLHLAGAGLMYFISTKNNFEEFYPLLLAYMICYMPTLALVNAIALKQVNNAEKEFSNIRVYGTLGWIAAGLLIGWMAWEQKGSLVNTFKVTAAVSLVMGLFSFTLPDTPPGRAGTTTTIRDILGLDALKLLKQKNFLIFFISSMLICIPLAFYYQETNKFLNELNIERASAKMTLGQVSEAFFMFLMPFFFARFNIKKMLIFGMIAWVLRYILFGFGDADSGLWMLYLGIVLHGICYDFFFVTGQIYTDKQAGEKNRSSAQGMITLATYGVGMLIGFWIAGNISEYYKTTEGHNWKNIWMIPAGFAAAITVLFFLFFKDDKKTVEETIRH